MKKFPFMMVLTLLVFTIGPVSAAAEDAAMVVDIQGAPAYYTNDGDQEREVGLMDFLAPGDKIKLGPQTSMVLNYFASGIRERITGPGFVIIGKDRSQEEGGAKIEASKVDYIPPPAEIESGDDQHMGAFALRSPSPPLPEITLLGHNKTAVRSTPVKFKWRSIIGADRYRLTVKEQTGAKVFETETNNNFYIMKNRVKPGKDYTWRVEALAGQNPLAAGIGQFRLLDLSSLINLIVSEKNIEVNIPQYSSEAKISKAMLYKEYELNDEAKVLLVYLKDRFPDSESIDRQLKELEDNYKK